MHGDFFQVVLVEQDFGDGFSLRVEELEVVGTRFHVEDRKDYAQGSPPESVLR
jgi:hypothetical protein